MPQKYNVIITGGGPGGALAAKKCAEAGMKTLLLEKKKMPRDKCCSGMVMGEWGQKLVREEFGEYPDNVMSETTMLEGYGMIVPGASVLTLDVKTPATWRKTLDTWMCEKAEEAGAALWDSAKVTGVKTDKNICTVTIKKDGNIIELVTDYAIGADGSNSTVRKSLLPDLEPVFFAGYREAYRVKLEHPENRFNLFPSTGTAGLFFTHDKGGYMLLEGVAAKGRLKETITAAKNYLIKNHGMPPDAAPEWRDGCVQSSLFREITTGKFRPAKNNVLLIGDAGGLNIPITGEGLASSLLSGRHAAESIVEAGNKSVPAEDIYLEWISGMLSRYQDIYRTGAGRIKEATAKKDPGAFAEAMLSSWELALKLF